MSTTDTSTTGGTRIRELIVTPIAFRDPPLLNSIGVHEPLALRVIVEVVTGGRHGGPRRVLRRHRPPGAA